MTKQQLKGVIAGAGYFAQFHTEAWNRQLEASITAVADPDKEKASAFAARWGIERVYADTETMLEQERPDFIDIITRPDTHAQLAEVAARRGVSIICQKPLAPTLEDCREMVKLCSEAGVRLIVHENWRWQPWYREISRLISEGVFGRIFYIGFRMRTGDGRGAEPYKVQPYFREMPRLLIYETLVHFLDTFRFLAGEINELSCVTQRINPLIAGEDCTNIQMTFESGSVGVIDANRISGPAVSEVAFGELRIEGDRGMGRMLPDGRIFVARHGEEDRAHEYAIPTEGYKGDSVLAFQRHAVECLTSGKVAESEGREYLKTIDAVEACYRSAEAQGHKQHAS